MFSTTPKDPVGKRFPSGWPVGLGLTLFYLLLSGFHLGSSDEEDLYLQTARLGMSMERLAGFMPHPLTEQPTLPSAVYEPGLCAAAVPFYFLGRILECFGKPDQRVYLRRTPMVLPNLLLTAATSILLFRFCLLLGAERRHSTIACLLFGLATLAVPYSKTFFREPFAGFLALLGGFCLVRYARLHNPNDLLLWISTIPLLAVTKLSVLVILPGQLLYLALPKECPVFPWEERLALSHKIYLFFFIPACLAAAIFSAWKLRGPFPYAWLRSLFPDGSLGSWVQSCATRCLGLLFSWGKGLVWFSPPIVLSIIAWYRLCKQCRSEAILVLTVFVSLLLLYSLNPSWHGGACWGPRYLLPAIPWTLLPVAVWLRDGSWRLLLAGCFLLLGTTVQLAATAVYPQHYLAAQLLAHPELRESLDPGPTHLEPIYWNAETAPLPGHFRTVFRWLTGGNRPSGPPCFNPTSASPNLLWSRFRQWDLWDYGWFHWTHGCRPDRIQSPSGPGTGSSAETKPAVLSYPREL